MVIHPLKDVQRKCDLVDLGVWAMVTGRCWLVLAVTAAIQRQGLSGE
jgi:hypothetical protein